MPAYAALLRGINVGGRNKVPMARLRAGLTQLGFEGVQTLIASGNAVFRAKGSAKAVAAAVEGLLQRDFKLDDPLVKVLVLPLKDLEAVVRKKPQGFGEAPATYHSDVLFLMDLAPAKALGAFDPREGVDKVWAGPGVIYSQRLSARRTQSRLNRVMGTPFYRQMTIRNWNTTTKLLALLKGLG